MEEEQTLIKLIESEVGESCSQALKHRHVKHFGYAFLYSNNNVNSSKPLLEQPIPTECDVIWPRLGDKVPVARRPDQLTVNKYQPGQGIWTQFDIEWL